MARDAETRAPRSGDSLLPLDASLATAGATGSGALALPMDQEIAPRERFSLIDLLRDRRWFCGVILLLIVLAAVFAPLVAPYSPTEYHPTIVAQAPTRAHLLGTDELGRDILSRIIYGARVSLAVGIAAILLGGIFGTFLGIIAGYARGWVDQVVTIIVDAILSFPSIILALAIAAVLGRGVANLVVALAFVRIPIYARLARGQALQVRSLDYITAAHASGTRTWRILLRHILPNIFSPLLVQGTLSVSFAILDESVVSFLGVGGVEPPDPEWGGMITAAQSYIFSDPWMLVGPALAIIITVLSLNLVGDALRDRLDPRTARAAASRGV
jgi:peptide/nickel transport system permease protein